MSYRTGRWFRLLQDKSQNPLFPEPSSLSLVLSDCRGDGMLFAPVMREWFIYTPTERTVEVKEINHTCSDIRWFIGRLMAPVNSDPVLPRIPHDRLIVWSNKPELVEGNIILASAEPDHEWMVYMAWVRYVRTRSTGKQKGGRLRRSYGTWFERTFPEEENPINGYDD